MPGLRQRWSPAMAGMIFTEGHELGAEMAPLVQPGRVLSADEAKELLSRFEPTRRVAKK
jgi:hypothetical protein